MQPRGVMRCFTVLMKPGNVIGTHEHASDFDFREW
jgi:hypothetical protein